MEVGDTLHAAGRRPCGPRAPGLAASLLLVVVVAQHKAEQQAWHDDVADAKHGEVAACGAGEDQLAGQREARHVAAHARAQVQLAREHVQRVVGRLGGHLHHHVAVEDIRREEDLRVKRGGALAQRGGTENSELTQVQ